MTGLIDEKINAKILENLFKNFGRLSQILFLQSKKSALIEYECEEGAFLATQFLNN